MKVKSLIRSLRKYARPAQQPTVPRFVPFDEAFPDVPKLRWRAPLAIATPRAVDLHFKVDATHLQTKVYLTPPDFVAIVPSALYSAGNNVVLTLDGDVVTESSNAGKPLYMDPRHFRDTPGVTVPGLTLPLRSRFNNYFHLIADCLPRCIAAKDAFPNSAIGLFCPGGLSESESYFLDRLGMADFDLITEPVNDVDGPVAFEKLLFTPQKTRWQAGWLPPEYVKVFRDRLHPGRRGRRNRRLLISRQRAKRRVESNWNELQESLQPLGFESVELESLSLDQQIDTVFDAEIVVGVHGAGLTNILFSPPGLRVVEILPGSHLPPHYYYLSHSLGHTYSVVYSDDSTSLNPAGFKVNLAAVRRRVQEAL